MGIIKNILQLEDGDLNSALVVFEEFSCPEPFFQDPIDSTSLSIFFVSRLSGVHTIVPLSSIVTICVKLPFKHGFVVLPRMQFQ